MSSASGFSNPSRRRASLSAAASIEDLPSHSGLSRRDRSRTVRQLAILPMTTDRAMAADPSASSERRYCSRRSRTLPETGPSTLARNRPFSEKNASETPRSAHRPMSGGLHDTSPKQTTLPRVWMGTRSRVSCSTRTCTVSPSRARYAPWVVTQSVFRSCFMSFAVSGQRPGQIALHGSSAAEVLGHAGREQRAFLAFRGIRGAGRGARAVKLVHARRQRFGFGAQGWREIHVLAPPRGAIEQRARRDGPLKRLFQAQCLRAQLDHVAVIRLGPSPFVFHRERLPEPVFPRQRHARRRRAKLHHVGLPAQPELQRPHPKPARNAEAGPAFRPRLVRPIVQLAPFGREPVLRPYLLDMNQPPLPLAERQMLEPRERQ